MHSAGFEKIRFHLTAGRAIAAAFRFKFIDKNAKAKLWRI
jgi:hypothetical protein